MSRRVRLAFIVLLPLLVIPARTLASSGDGDFVFRGTLESVRVEQGSVVVLRLKVAGFDTMVRVPDAARIRSAAGEALTVDGLALGAELEITGDWDGDGFLATSVTVPETEQVGAVGAVEQILPGKLVVSGIEFELDGNSAPVAASLAVGQMVAVLGLPSPAGAVLATQVVSQEQFWLFGRIAVKDDANRTVTVASRVVATTEKTRIIGADKSLRTFKDLEVGMQVSVTGRSIAGKLTADEIRVVAANGRVEIRGQLVTIGTGSITVKSLDIPFEIKTDAKTEIIGGLSVGTLVSVAAILQPDGTLVATRIVSQGGKDNGRNSESVFSGAIERIDTAGNVIVASGVTLRLSGTTVIRSGDKEIKITDLKVGDKVKVTGTKQSDGSINATRIEVLPVVLPPPETMFDGSIEQIAAEGGKIVVRGITVVISSQTVIRSGDRVLKGSDLKLGDKVKVMGTKQADGSVGATRIDVLPTAPPPAESVFDGSIEQIAADGGKIVVRAITVVISSQTVIRSGDRTLKVTDLKVGDKVKVTGTRQADGSVSATRIDVVAATPPTTETMFDGLIERIAADAGKIVVRGITVIVSSQTTIRSGGREIKVTDLKVGDLVKVKGKKQSDGSVAATLIEVVPK